MSVQFHCRWCAVTWFALSSVAAHADGAADGVSIGFEEAIERTLAHNPALIAFGYQIEAQQGRVTQAGLPPNLELGFSLENALGTGDFSGLDRAEATVSLGWVWERGKRERRVDAATAGITVLEAEAEIRRLDAAAETARRFVDCLAWQARLDRSIEGIELALQTVDAVRERVEAARSPEADLARVEAEVARRRLVREDAEHELLTALRRLSAQWGETGRAVAAVQGDVRRLPLLEPFEALRDKLDGNPDIARYVSERRWREAELELAQAQARPDWSFEAGLRRLEISDDFALVGGLTVPLTTRNRNQGRIAEAEARLAQADAERTVTQVEIETELFAMYQELKHNLDRARILREDVMPALEKALAATEQAYRLGRYGYLELRTVQAEVFGARNELLEASVEAHRRVIEIERLTGLSIAAPAGTSRENP